jgi:hypothetical protein
VFLSHCVGLPCLDGGERTHLAVSRSGELGCLPSELLKLGGTVFRGLSPGEAPAALAAGCCRAHEGVDTRVGVAAPLLIVSQRRSLARASSPIIGPAVLLNLDRLLHRRLVGFMLKFMSPCPSSCTALTSALLQRSGRPRTIGPISAAVAGCSCSWIAADWVGGGPVEGVGAVRNARRVPLIARPGSPSTRRAALQGDVKVGLRRRRDEVVERVGVATPWRCAFPRSLPMGGPTGCGPGCLGSCPGKRNFCQSVDLVRRGSCR